MLCFIDPNVMDRHRQLKSKVTKFHYADNSINSLQCQCEASTRKVEVRSPTQMIDSPGRAVTSQQRKAARHPGGSARLLHCLSARALSKYCE